MDRRLAALAGAFLAGAGTIGILARRHAADPAAGMPADALDVIEASALEEPVPQIEPTVEASQRMPLGPQAIFMSMEQLLGGEPFDLDSAPRVDMDDPGLKDIAMSNREPIVPPPYKEVLTGLVDGYPMDAGKRLDLRLKLERIADAIESGKIAEGTAVVEFDWTPAPGLLMNAAVAVLATRDYVRVNFSDLEGNLRAPELDVFLGVSETRINPDTNVRRVDLDERRSEMTVTQAKLHAIEQGITVHPGDAASVLVRSGITRHPFHEAA